MKTLQESLRALADITTVYNTYDYFKNNPEFSRRKLPRYLVLPENTLQISDILTLANKNNFPVFITGKGTETDWHSIKENGIVLSTVKLKNTMLIHETDSIAEINCGHSAEDIYNQCKKASLLFPYRGFNGTASTLGGNYSSGTESIFDFYFGNLLINTLGIEFITPQGKKVKFGGKTVKNATGYNFPRILYGTRGRLGIITKLFIKLYMFQKIITFMMTITVEDVIKNYRKLNTTIHSPSALIINNDKIYVQFLVSENKEEKLKNGIPPFLENKMFDMSGTEDITGSIYRSHYDTHKPLLIIKALLRGRLRSNLMEKINEIRKKFNGQIAITVFGSDGVFYFVSSLHFKYDTDDNAVKTAYLFQREIISSLKGAIIYLELKNFHKNSFMPFKRDNLYMAKLKSYFDPLNILNPLEYGT